MTMLPNKTAAEKRTVTFRFADDMPVGVTLSAPAVTKSQISGNDTSGAAALTVGSPQVSGSDVLALVSAGLDGSNYKLVCEVQASDGEVYDRIAFLSIRANAAA